MTRFFPARIDKVCCAISVTDNYGKIIPLQTQSARVVELVDTQDLKSCDHCGRAGSIPAPGTNQSEKQSESTAKALFLTLIFLTLTLELALPCSIFKNFRLHQSEIVSPTTKVIHPEW